jgi:ribonuclease HI
MELLACIEGLKALKQESEVVLYSDSNYLLMWLMKLGGLKWDRSHCFHYEAVRSGLTSEENHH